MGYVFKISCGDTLRRVIVPPRGDFSGPELTFNELEAKIREIFKISPALELKITYVDAENDVVTIGGDQDLEDACVIQLLNPVRLDVKIVDDNRIEDGKPTQPSPGTRCQQAGSSFLQVPQPKSSLESLVQGVVPGLTNDALKQLFTAIEPLAKAAASSGGIPQIAEWFMNTLAGQACPGSSLHSLPSQSPNSPSAETLKGPSCDQPKQNMESQRTEMPPFHAPKTSPEKKTWGREDFNRRIFHKNVQCDGCGMHPIVGPRFKSIKNDNFDLCISCFMEIGNETDYQRFDRPIHPHRTYRHPTCGVRMLRTHHMGPPHMGPPSPFRHSFRHGPFGWKCEFQDRTNVTNVPPIVNSVGEYPCGKLDARFVRDVTIFDGTELTPGTKFTKIWQFRNTGNLPWPQQTQLVHVGGDILHSAASVLLELPEDGLAPDNEIEASVDLIAPEQTGQYVSHWKLMAPSGQRFGQRVWVLIQVVPNDEQSPQVEESLQHIERVAAEENAAFVETITEVGMTNSGTADVAMVVPEVSFLSELSNEGSASAEQQVEVMNGDHSTIFNSEVGGFSIVEMPVDRFDGSLSFKQRSFDVGHVSHATEVLDQTTMALNQVQNGDIEQLFGLQLNETLLSSDAANSPAERTNPIGVALSAPLTEEQSLGELSMSETISSAHDDLQSILQETLLEHLESQGFSQRTLNIELLQKNKNNLQSTIQDLIAATEWDPMLSKLQEMGFHDKDLSLRLMFKNNGSLKRVVKELVQMQVAGGNGIAAVRSKEKAL